MNGVRPRLARFLTGLGIWMSLAGGHAQAQEADRERESAVAARTAAEADRLFSQKQYAAALKLYESEREVRARLGDLRYEAHALRGKGCCLAELGDERQAIAAWEAARAVDLKRDDPGFAGYDDLLIGKAQIRLGQLEAASKSLQQAVTRLSQAIDRDHQADARLLLARIALEQQRPEEAVRQALRVVDLARELKDNRRLADAWLVAGLGLRDNEEPGAAFEALSDAQRRYESLKLTREVAQLDAQIGDLLHDLQRPDLAAMRFASAATGFGAIRDPEPQISALRALATIRLDRKEYALAEAAAAQALELALAAKLGPVETDARLLLARILDLKGDPATALQRLQPALDAASADRKADGRRFVLLALLAAEIAQHARRTDDARRWVEEAGEVVKEQALTDLVPVVEQARRAPADRIPPDQSRSGGTLP